MSNVINLSERKKEYVEVDIDWELLEAAVDVLDELLETGQVNMIELSEAFLVIGTIVEQFLPHMEAANDPNKLN
jgi:hypothetical protein